MVDKTNSNYSPLTLNELKKKINKNKRVKVGRNDFAYGKMNKGYKNLDFTKDYFTVPEIREHLDDKYFKTWRILLRQGDLKWIQRSDRINDKVYLKDNVEALCLLKEQACIIERNFFEKKRKIARNKKKLRYRPKYKPFHFNSAYRGDVFLFSYPVAREWKAELLTDFLKTKEFLFDEDSPHWKGMPKLRYFCLKNLMNSKVEKWEQQVQRFLAKKD